MFLVPASPESKHQCWKGIYPRWVLCEDKNNQDTLALSKAACGYSVAGRATRGYLHQSRLMAYLTMNRENMSAVQLQPQCLTALLTTPLFSGLLQDNRGTRCTTERASCQVTGEPFFLEWLQHPSWKEDTKLESKVISFQSMLPIQIKPTPNPCGLLFLDSKRAGQHLTQLVPNPRAQRVHSTFLLLMWNSSIPIMEDFYQGV